jgi:hypothetical protein
MKQKMAAMGRNWGVQRDSGFWAKFLASYRFHRQFGQFGRWRCFIVAWQTARAHH